MSGEYSSLSDVAKERDERSSLMCVLDSNDVWQPLLGVAGGGGMALQISASPPRHAQQRVVVVQGTSVDFVIDEDSESVDLPEGMRITRLITSAHNGATPPLAVSTKWRLRLYTHSDRDPDQIILDSNFTLPAVAAKSNDIDSTGIDYFDLEADGGDGQIYGNIEILGGESSATFTIVAIL